MVQFWGAIDDPGHGECGKRLQRFEYDEKKSLSSKGHHGDFYVFNVYNDSLILSVMQEQRFFPCNIEKQST